MNSSVVPPAAAASAPSDVQSDEEDILVWGQGEDEPDLSVNHLIRHITMRKMNPLSLNIMIGFY
eukprot:scaffold6883_cov62-Cyclotella_meneghiniana.AAC.1